VPALDLTLVSAFLAGLAAGGLLIWAVVARRSSAATALAAAEQSRRREAEAALRTAEERARELDRRVAVADEKEEQVRRRLDEQREFLDRARSELEDTFQALASAALRGTTEHFFTLAEQKMAAVREQANADLDQRKSAIETLLGPIRQGLDKVESRTHELERARVDAYSRIDEQVRQLAESAAALGEKTTTLSTALRSSQVRGAWGEIALRNVVEMAGMTERCDFFEQTTVEGGLRPDMVVRLPEGRFIAVDAKAPLSAFTEAAEATDDASRKQALARHVRDLRAHVRALANRDYASALPGELDLVVLFLPGDPFLGAAISTEPGLLDESLRARVLLATPTTLLALLRTVAIYWQQRELAKNAEEIASAARELYDRAAKFAEELAGVGKGLQSAIDAYNRARGSFEHRLLPMGRRLEEMRVTEQSRRELTAPEPIDTALRDPD
jgi:DNA recombination protein RmuC